MSADRIPTPDELLNEWESDCAQLASIGAMVDPSKLIPVLVSRMRESLKAEADRVVSLAEGAQITGFSVDHLRHQVAQGRIPNAGRKHAPKVRVGDLPRKAGRKTATSYDPTADAVQLMSRGKSA